MDFDSISQLMVDKLSPRPGLRWAAFSFLLTIFFIKIVLTGAHHLIAYCMGVYLFHGFILFATPKDDRIPDPFEAEPEEVDYVPEEGANNLRPFIRNMPEYTYWLFCIKVTLISHVLTLTKFTDIPVFTPVLVVYFVFMVAATGYKIYEHAKKYNYNPFSQSKLSSRE